MWFEWKGKNSAAMGLWINKLPKVIVPSERIKSVTIPGKAGQLNLREGEDVYDGYPKEIVVICENKVITPELLNWLRGSGTLIVGNDSRFAYDAHIAGEVRFQRVGNWLSQATIPFFVQPFKRAVNESQYRITMTQSSSVINPGHVKSKPLIRMTGTDPIEISSGDTHMALYRRPEVLTIDCDAEVMLATAVSYSSSTYYYSGDYFTNEGGLYRSLAEGYGSAIEWEYVSEAPDEGETFDYLWHGTWAGEFLRIPVGITEILMSETSNMTVDPRWRWI